MDKNPKTNKKQKLNRNADKKHSEKQTQDCIDKNVQ